MSFDPEAKADASCVWFQMHFPEGPAGAAITSQALEKYFGAEPTPAGLLASYRANYRAIHEIAQQKGSSMAEGGVIVTEADLAAWTR